MKKILTLQCAILLFSPVIFAQEFSDAQTNPFSLSNEGTHSTPQLLDIDNDGDLDCLTGVSDGDFYYFENTGTTSNPNFENSSVNPFGLASIGPSPKMTSGDIDGDGDLDILVGNSGGDYYYLENTGTASAPTFAASQHNPFGLDDVSTVSSPTFIDIDNDGDLDIFTGSGNGNTYFMENTGSITAPSFDATTAVVSPFGITGGHGNWNRPSFTDLDNDGDMDLMMGVATANKFVYFENIGTASAPDFADSQENPFNLSIPDVGYTVPSFGDIDGDSDIDLLSGLASGDFILFKNDEITGLKEDALVGFNFYPNPTVENVAINMGKVYESIEIEISNLLGQVIRHETFESMQNISTKIDAEKGIYFITIKAAERTATIRIVKQ